VSVGDETNLATQRARSKSESQIMTSNFSPQRVTRSANKQSGRNLYCSLAPGAVRRGPAGSGPAGRPGPSIPWNSRYRVARSPVGRWCRGRVILRGLEELQGNMAEGNRQKGTGRREQAEGNGRRGPAVSPVRAVGSAVGTHGPLPCPGTAAIGPVGSSDAQAWLAVWNAGEVSANLLLSNAP